MRIAGIGMIGSQGLGISAFEEALKNGWQRPGETAASGARRLRPGSLEVGTVAAPRRCPDPSAKRPACSRCALARTERASCATL